MVGLLQYIHCETCDKDFLVGMNGKDIRKGHNEPSYDGGKYDGVPYIVIGKSKERGELPDEVPCEKCGTVCKVRDSRSVG